MGTIEQVFAQAIQDHRAGRLAQAEQLYRWVLEQDSGHTEALHKLGILALQTGNANLAVAYLGRAVTCGTTNPACHNNLGVAYTLTVRLAEAADALEQAIRLAPDYAEAHSNLGSVLRRQGKPLAAAASLERALRLKPDYADAHNNLGLALRDLGRLEEAAASHEKAVRIRPECAEAYNNWGMALQDQGCHAAAVDRYEQALRLRPAYAEARCNLGMAFEEQGKLDLALACHLEVLRQRPNYPMAYYHLAQFAAQGLYHFTPENIEQGKALLAGGRLEAVDAGLLHFALADVLDRQGRQDEAFVHYQAGNDGMKRHREQEGEGFRAERHRDWIDQVAAVFDREYFARVRSLGSDSERPVFVVGMPRSGTTLATHILSSHSQVCGPGELPDIPQLVAALQTRFGDSGYPACMARVDAQTVRDLAENYLQRLSRVDGSAQRVIDKLPTNFLHLGLIATLFPRARIIHCRRDPLDVCLSCYRQNFKNIDFAWSLEDLAAYYREYERLTAHWRQVLPLPMLEVGYEDLVARQEAVTRELVAFCGLDWDPRCLEFHENRRVVQTASSLQVRRPLYATSIGRWKNYRSHLGALIAALGCPGANEPAGPVGMGKRGGFRLPESPIGAECAFSSQGESPVRQVQRAKG